MAFSRPSRSFPFRLDFPAELPIAARAEEITAAIQSHQVVILAGETGSGKTTQIPKMCLAAGRGTQGRIACTQPRRVAALSISRRVAEELGVEWGGLVGCKVRFNDQTSRDTAIKFLTDGMLLAEVQGDPMLREYDTIIIDEAHERSLNIDFLLGHLRNLRFRRPDLKIIITSATIDTEAFSVAFDGAPVIKVEGRTFPVEVIYAPLDSFGSDYTENDEYEEKADVAAVASAKAEALHYIDGAIEAVERIVRESDRGDLLVFLPSERDIREVGDGLEGRGLRGCEIVPLFGRLSNTEQQRVFAATQRRKIVLATNIAETSLTIPGIRFVVDTGLARISRYSPASRTRRLPIEEIAQSSAEQRKGRAGRVAEGVCVRLYSEKDFLERPRFTQPEIQRANLADVILRMKAFGLGDIERFPFINMPAAKSIRAGYGLLEELGALEVGRAMPHPPGIEASDDRGSEAARPAVPELTAIGRELARLPVDPTVGRMILQARTEKAVREVVVIAAGLSIQDPRERPIDKQQQADAAHRRFAHPDSDFLTLLNIWNAYHGEFESLSQAKLRRFCRDHFLSYTRMREWRDIHAQLMETLEGRDDFKLTSAFTRAGTAGSDERQQKGNGGRRDRHSTVAVASSRRDNKSLPRAQTRGGGDAPPSKPGPATGDDSTDPVAFGTPAYRAIHRSILAGLLGNIAQLDEENGGYKATHDRKVALFPGSVLFRRDDARRKPTPAGKAPDASTGAGKRLPKWIMAAEIVETTRLYARTCARLDPLWALELGQHLARVAHSEPFWNEAAGRVMVRQRTRLYGLELESRAVGYGKIDPRHATEIFIREGLVNDTLTFPLDFLTHNRAVREKVEDLLTRARDSGYLNVDEAAYRFYADRLLPLIEAGGGRSPSGHDVNASLSPSAGSAATEGRPAAGPYPHGISAVPELVDLFRHRRASEPRFLFMSAEDLHDPNAVSVDEAAFPPALPVDNRVLPLAYAYKPGEPEDGVTVEVSVREAETLTVAALDWAVPGHLEPKVEHYLRALPKELRRAFVPLGETARSLAEALKGKAGAPAVSVGETAAANRQDRAILSGSRQSLPEALADEIAGRYRVAIDPAIWADKPPPDHLRVRIRVVDANGREIVASRELTEIRAALLAQSRAASKTIAREEPSAWRAARAQWETPAFSTWAFEALPERVLVTEQAGAPVFAFPGLLIGADGVARRLFKTPEEASAATERAVSWLLERQLGHDLMWTQRDLRALREVGPLAATLVPLEDLQEQAFQSIRAWAIDWRRLPGGGVTSLGAADVRTHTTCAEFTAAVEQAKHDLRGLVPRFVDLMREILTLRQELLVVADPPAGLARDLSVLIPPNFLATTPFSRLAEFPRYLKAMKLRAGRWRKNPTKDAERVAQMTAYEKAYEQLRRDRRDAPDQLEALRWLLEEFRVSVFAQEIGTAEPVSPVKLDRAFAAARGGAAAQPATIATPKPIVAAPVADPNKKSAPLKNLNGLDKLFGR